MKNKIFITKLLYLTVLVTVLISIVSACGQVDNRYADLPNGNDYVYLATEPDVSENIPIIASVEVGEIDSFVTLSDEDRILLRESIFIGRGEVPQMSGDGLIWYLNVFGLDFHFIPINIIDTLEHGAYSGWRAQFESGQRDWREFSIRALIEDFNINMLDVIETDLFVFSDIEALFSNDVNTIWNAFPGYGTLHNNRAYSPEWLLNNIERAVYGELIPISDLDRVINTAVNNFGLVGDITTHATTALQTAITSQTTPTPHQLTFDLEGNLRGGSTGGTTSTTTPPNIQPITINAWDEILHILTTQHSGFPINNPTRQDHDFIGWYLDTNLTWPLEETTRMPARNTTLYARWQPTETTPPTQPPTPTIHTVTFYAQQDYGTFDNSGPYYHTITIEVKHGDTLSHIPHPYETITIILFDDIWLLEGTDMIFSTSELYSLVIESDMTFIAQYRFGGVL